MVKQGGLIVVDNTLGAGMVLLPFNFISFPYIILLGGEVVG